MTTIILVHSPLLGPFTWSLVANELRRRDVVVIVPDLHGEGVDEERPYHQQHAQNSANALKTLPTNEPIMLVAHSGAGPLLPAIRQQLCQPIAAYLFVDAGVAQDGQSRLDMLAEELPEMAPQLHKLLASGQRWPQWRDEDLAEAIPDAKLRQRLLAELTSQPLEFFEEPIPVFAAWPDAPCIYLQLSAAYDYSTMEARRRGWLCGRLDGSHFHMLVDETAVANIILQILAHFVSE
ncbi:hypothetical protein MNBD_CHLOROFLEXI01-1972 [hydrothermal vent metagenome]|uniref:AB hydrolase-1 domain-containing protein n=1 Tax=hydrothermal vent metagenome TaxID=652676 RepID=A0A3B0VSR8_9ZZZZ